MEKHSLSPISTKQSSAYLRPLKCIATCLAAEKPLLGWSPRTISIRFPLFLQPSVHEGTPRQHRLTVLRFPCLFNSLHVDPLQFHHDLTLSWLMESILNIFNHEAFANVHHNHRPHPSLP